MWRLIVNAANWDGELVSSQVRAVAKLTVHIESRDEPSH